MSFKDKIVIITGAGAGIGEATAVHFAKQCASLSLIDINSDDVSKVAERCENLSKTSVLKLVIDITKDDDLKRAVEKTVEEYGKIDVVVNSAGVFNNRGILDSDVLSAFDSTINVNLRAIVAMTHFAAPALIESKGCVVNIASVMARLVAKNSLAYTVSKVGVVHFTKSVALELADKGVRVNSISPGPVNTNILLKAGFSQEECDVAKENFLKSTALHRLINAEEIAEMAGYLASDKARCITGTDILIDSGMTLIGV